MQRVHLRNDVLDVMTWQLACGSLDGCIADPFRCATYYGGLRGMNDERVTNETYHQMVSKTLADTVTLGLYSNFFSEK